MKSIITIGAFFSITILSELSASASHKIDIPDLDIEKLKSSTSPCGLNLEEIEKRQDKCRENGIGNDISTTVMLYRLTLYKMDELNKLIFVRNKEQVESAMLDSQIKESEENLKELSWKKRRSSKKELKLLKQQQEERKRSSSSDSNEKEQLELLQQSLNSLGDKIKKFFPDVKLEEISP